MWVEILKVWFFFLKLFFKWAEFDDFFLNQVLPFITLPCVVIQGHCACIITLRLENSLKQHETGIWFSAGSEPPLYKGCLANNVGTWCFWNPIALTRILPNKVLWPDLDTLGSENWLLDQELWWWYWETFEIWKVFPGALIPTWACPR